MNIQKGALVSLQENREHHPPGNGGRLAGRVPLQHQLRGCQRVHQHTDRDEEICPLFFREGASSIVVLDMIKLIFII